MLIWPEVIRLTRLSEKRSAREAKRSGLTHPVVCLNFVVVEQEESEWLGILSRGAQRTG